MLWSRVVPVNEFHLVFKKLLQRKDTFFTYIQLFIVCVFCESIDIMARRSGKTVLPPQVQAWTLSSQRLSLHVRTTCSHSWINSWLLRLVHTLVFRSSVLFLFDCEPVTIFKFESYYYYYMFEVLFVALMFNKSCNNMITVHYSAFSCKLVFKIKRKKRDIGVIN